MAWMVYLIVVTARTVVKAYDPYDILGVSRVSCTVRRVATKSEGLQLTILLEK